MCKVIFAMDTWEDTSTLVRLVLRKEVDVVPVAALVGTESACLIGHLGRASERWTSTDHYRYSLGHLHILPW